MLGLGHSLAAVDSSTGDLLGVSVMIDRQKISNLRLGKASEKTIMIDRQKEITFTFNEMEDVYCNAQDRSLCCQIIEFVD